jgi:hypothetical protein
MQKNDHCSYFLFFFVSMTCHVRVWKHKKTFPAAERARIQTILYDWGFRSVAQVRYKPSTDTIVVWTPHHDVAKQFFISDKGETLYFLTSRQRILIRK